MSQRTVYGFPETITPKRPSLIVEVLCMAIRVLVGIAVAVLSGCSAIQDRSAGSAHDGAIAPVALDATAPSQENSWPRKTGGMDQTWTTSDDSGFAAKRLGDPDRAELTPNGALLQVLSDLDLFIALSGGEVLVVDPDRFGLGESVDGRNYGGMTILASAAQPLVVRADQAAIPRSSAMPDSGRYRLIKMPGLGSLGRNHIISPGGPVLALGPNAAVEDDDLTLVFDPPVSAAGFTILTPSADGLSFVEVNVLDAEGRQLFKGQVNLERLNPDSGARYPRPGSAFWGCIAETPLIARIEIDEQDSDDACPDSNIGYAELWFAPNHGPGDLRMSPDLDGNGVVGPDDVGLYTLMRSTNPASNRWLDFNGDGVIDEGDLSAILSAIGERPIREAN